MTDDDDIIKQTTKLLVVGNTLQRKFSYCSREVKMELFRSHCYSIYCNSLWSRYKVATMNCLKVCYNDILKKLLGLPRWCSSSLAFARNGVNNLDVIRRHSVFSLRSRVELSTNSIITSVRQSSAYVCGPIQQRWLGLLFVQNTLEKIEESRTARLAGNQDQHRALSRRTRTLLGRDKERYVRNLAEDVEGHLNANDLRPAYRALKKLRSKSPSRASAIRAADGRLVSDMDRQMALIFAESLEVLVMALEALHEEAKPLGLGLLAQDQGCLQQEGNEIEEPEALSLQEKVKVLARMDAGASMRAICAEFDIKSSTFYPFTGSQFARGDLTGVNQISLCPDREW
ncbi:hypothetical protein GWK47_032467 [Chionoecetes opilio]|uniref:Uncharacterized protein n=1 Tax=Chionoecetes opilio TaxID=41210 RepID=A0A8J5D0Q5_CHIOP|nr:hypothetical protein GWK47_032467 [Chionoecetes opilio]